MKNILAWFFLCCFLSLTVCQKDDIVTGPVSSDTTVSKNSPFIGTWAQIYDTSTQEKKNFWYDSILDYYKVPDTMTFLNDSVWLHGNRESYSSLNDGTVDKYWWNSDTVCFTKFPDTNGLGAVIYTDTVRDAYKLIDSTLDLNYDPTRTTYVPIYKKLTH